MNDVAEGDCVEPKQLDPEPWLNPLTGYRTARTQNVRKDRHRWDPRPEFEQDRALYRSVSTGVEQNK